MANARQWLRAPRPFFQKVLDPFKREPLLAAWWGSGVLLLLALIVLLALDSLSMRGQFLARVVIFLEVPVLLLVSLCMLAPAEGTASKALVRVDSTPLPGAKGAGLGRGIRRADDRRGVPDQLVVRHPARRSPARL